MSDTWPRDALPRGSTLFGYQIVGILGRGGFGITYRATDRIDQQFAIKECYPKQFAVRQGAEVLPADAADAAMFGECLDRFTKEARALTMFSKSGAAGQGVVKVITFFETNGTAYIVMEFVDGASLAALIAAHPQGVPEAQLVAILRYLLEALACVHAHGLMHRDIKPANVFLRADGRPVLLDFGAARAVELDQVTQFTQIYTESYGPIEQVEGRPQGAFSDLYSLGVTCYRMLGSAGGRTAPTAIERNRMLQQGKNDPLMPAAVLGEGRYEPNLLRAIDWLLQVAPEDRPQTVPLFLSMLDGPRLDDAADEATRLGPPLPAAEASAAIDGADATILAPRSTAAPQPKSVLQPAMILIACLLVAGGIGYGAYWRLHDVAKVKTIAATPAPATSAPATPAPATSAPATSASVTPAAGPVPAMQSGVSAADAAFNSRDYQTALRLYRPAALAGNAQAQYQLGYIYQLGLGVPISPPTAIAWYRKSAAQGLAAAQSQIGYLYMNGLGVPRDYAAAAQWYGLAAASGFATAQAQLGVLSLHGQGVPQDDAAALRWSQLAADQGSAPARYLIGYIYQHGRGVPVDPAAAFHAYTLAATQGLPAAQYSLGRCYAEGFGVAPDPAAARGWMQKAAAGGNAPAHDWLIEH